jgi:Peptidase family M3
MSGRICCCALNNPSQQQQRRQIVGDFFRDVWRTKSFNPGNPVLDYIETRDQSLISAFQSYQVLMALPEIESQLQAAVAKLEASNDAAGMPITDLLQHVNDAEEPLAILQQISALFMLNVEKQKWYETLAEVSSVQPFFQRLANPDVVLDSIRDQGNIIAKTPSFFLQQPILQKKQAAEYPEIHNALAAMQNDILLTEATVASPRTLALVYNYVGLRTEQAKACNFPTIADEVFATRAAAANVDDVRMLHDSVWEHLQPALEGILGKRKSKDELELESFLGSNSGHKQSNKKIIPPERIDELTMLRLEQHVTLDGALLFLSKLSEDLLGVSFHEDKHKLGAWDKDVRVFNTYDEKDGKVCLGTFFLDPYQRHGKLDRSVTLPMVHRNVKQPPLVCMSLEIESPVWDTDPVRLTWEQCESLFHEYGHVLQFLLSKPTAGGILGPQKMPLDLSELVPKVRVSFQSTCITLSFIVAFCPLSFLILPIVASRFSRCSLWNSG